MMQLSWALREAMTKEGRCLVVIGQRPFDFRSYFGDGIIDFRSTYELLESHGVLTDAAALDCLRRENEYLLVGTLLNIGSPVRFEFSIVEQLCLR